MHREPSAPEIRSNNAVIAPTGQAQKLPQQPRLAQLAPLPVLADREHFTAMVGRQLAACRRLGTRPAVLIIEVDAWSAGRVAVAPARLAGLLQAIGARLRARVRGTDLVAQWGEQRFGVVLLGCGRSDVSMVQERLHKALKGAYGLDDALLQVDLRIGAAAYPDAVVSGGELVSAAEAALMTQH